MSSMETKFRWMLVTAIAPVAWGSTYFVTQQYLPEDYPLWGSVIRALPAGLLLLAITRTLPRGAWWWKSLVLGTLNVGAFFVLIYLAAQLLPSSIASTLMATSPAVMMLLAWPLLSERPHILPLSGAVLGFLGVGAMVLTGAGEINGFGVLASLVAMLMSSVGFILTKRWGAGVSLLSLASWQLVAGGVAIVPVAVIVEGMPPTLGSSEILAFGYLTFFATGLAYVAWFTGLRHLTAGAVGLIGLLNAVTGVLLGTLIASETLRPLQVLGMLLVFVGILLGQPVVARRMRVYPDGASTVRATPSRAGIALTAVRRRA